MAVTADVDDRRRPATATARLREIGPRWQRDIRVAGDDTRAFYLPLLAAAPRAGVAVARDIAYGPHPRQVLDVYRPPGARHAPVIAFVHGGAFVRGSKDTNAGMYANVLTWFARHGLVGVNVEYRLAPEAPYPGGAADVALACRWIAQRIGEHGGDPARLCLFGHSAGGTHVATLACDPDPDVLALPPHDARCLVLVSARLRADALPANPNAEGVRAYFGANESRYDAVSPATHAARLDRPVLVATAQYENPLLDVYGLEFALAVARARGVAPLHIALADHNHVSIVAHFNTSEQWLGEEIVAFCENAWR